MKQDRKHTTTPEARLTTENRDELDGVHPTGCLTEERTLKMEKKNKEIRKGKEMKKNYTIGSREKSRTADRPAERPVKRHTDHLTAGLTERLTFTFYRSKNRFSRHRLTLKQGKSGKGNKKTDKCKIGKGKKKTDKCKVSKGKKTVVRERASEGQMFSPWRDESDALCHVRSTQKTRRCIHM